MDWKQLKELIELVSEKGFAEFEVERQGFRLRISNLNPAAASTHHPANSHYAPDVDSESNVSEVRDLGYAEAPAAIAQASAARASSRQAPGAADRGTEPGLHILKSPIVGTFYRAPSPESPPFVKVGDRVEPDTVVCIVEAMKLMNEIQAEISGQIAEVYVENAQAIEFDQPLFGIRL